MLNVGVRSTSTNLRFSSTLTGFHLSPPPVGHTYPSLQFLPEHLPVSRLVDAPRPHFTSRPRPALIREIPSCAIRRIPTNEQTSLYSVTWGGGI